MSRRPNETALSLVHSETVRVTVTYLHVPTLPSLEVKNSYVLQLPDTTFKIVVYLTGNETLLVMWLNGY